MGSNLFVVMGVCGSGKSRIGSALATALDVEFVEGDGYHPPENVARMRAGIPLTDDDRASWLRALAARLAKAQEAGNGLVVTCSALKRSYRDVLRSSASDVRFVYLRGTRALLADRLAGREGHFMPASLLDSQIEALQEPAADESAWVVDIAGTPSVLVDQLVTRVRTNAAPNH